MKKELTDFEKHVIIKIHPTSAASAVNWKSELVLMRKQIQTLFCNTKRRDLLLSKQHWKGSVLLAPVPPVLVSCGTLEHPNILTIAWTGVLNTHPPMVSISVRPTRYSYPILMKQQEFVINLPTSSLCRETDFCGCRSGKDIDKFAACHFTPEPAQTVAAPLIAECPVNLECKIQTTQPLGTHVLMLAEITAVNVEERYVDSKGKLNLQQMGLLAYAHGEYFTLGRKLGDFGFSVRKKKKTSKRVPKTNKKT